MRNSIIIGSFIVLLTCGKWAPETKHTVTTDSRVTTESKVEVQVKTTLDLVLEICGIIDEEGVAIPYSEWGDEPKECVALFESIVPLDVPRETVNE